MTAWTRLAVLSSRCRALVTGARLDREFNEELESHLAMLAEDLMRRGLTRDEAHREARLRLGGVPQLEETQRDARSLPMIETAANDVRYALRTLRKNPAFSVVAIATLAIGIGAGAAVFTVVSAVLLRPLPYKNPAELVRIFETNPLKNWTRNIAAPANYADWRAQNTTFTGVAAYEQFDSTGSGANDVFLTGFGEPQGLKALGVSGNLFEVLGTPPLLGRVFTDEEQWEGKARVVLLSYGLWQAAFGGDPAVVGRTIELSGRGYDVVGVMPRTFFFPGRDVQLWMPFGYTRQLVSTSRRPHWLGVIARLKPNVPIERAKDDMAAIARRLEAQYPDTNTQMGVRLEPLHESYANAPRTALLMLSGAVGLLFLIVCANIANLQFARGISRARELTIRRALGAGRVRLMRQLLTESLVLSAIAGALGIGIALLAKMALTRYAASAIPLFADVQVDRSVMLFIAALSVLAPAIFGIIPALTSSQGEHVGERGESGSREMRTLRNVLVAGEVALSIVLVVGAVLFVRSLMRLTAVDPGFNQQHAVAFTVGLPGARYPDAGARIRAVAAIEQRLKTEAGFQAVGATSTLALRGYTWTGDATVEGRAGDYERELRHSSVTRSYFPTMGVRLLSGRPFDESDTSDKPPVAIVNHALAARYFRGADPVGKRVAFGRPQDRSPWVTIVGVVADARQDALGKGAEPEAFSPITQRVSNPLTFVVRSAESPESVVATAKRDVQAVDKNLALTDVTTLQNLVDESTAGERFRTALLSGFAGIALLLAALGIYGVLAYFVSQRSREIGVRVALGAKPSQVFGMVVRQGMLPVLAGVVAGVALTIPATTLTRALLFEVQPIDPPAYATALTALVAVAFAACALPARRATRVDPLVALRDE